MSIRTVMAGLAVATFATTSLAGTFSIDLNPTGRRMGSGWSGAGGGGGEFRIYNHSGFAKALAVGLPGDIAAGYTGSSFGTFCIELNDYISNGQHNGQLNTGSVQGGVAGGNPDYLGDAAKWLYWNHRHATLALWNSSALTIAERNQALQYALWVLEDEMTSVPSGVAGTATTGVEGLANALKAAADSAALAPGGIDSKIKNRVVVINVGNNPLYEGQDQMAIVIPLPTTGGLGMAGLLGVLAIRRRVRL